MTLLKIRDLSLGSTEKMGFFRGLQIQLSRNAFDQIDMILKGNSSYSTSFSNSELGNITKLENLVHKIPSILNEAERKLQQTEKQLIQAKEEVESLLNMKQS